MAKDHKIRIGIIGGAFDPITNGHIELSQYILDRSVVEQVWITPCFSHRYNKKMVSAKHRLKMCKLASKIDKRIKVFDYEIRNELDGGTYNFLVRLLNEDFAKNKYDFSMIIGLDNANTFDRWINFEILEKMIKFIVAPRKGVKRDKKVNWYLKSPHIYWGDDFNSIMEISSTFIRENFYDQNMDKFLDEKVIKYIRKNNLYERPKNF